MEFYKKEYELKKKLNTDVQGGFDEYPV